jgi:hypothetical protein
MVQSLHTRALKAVGRMRECASGRDIEMKSETAIIAKRPQGKPAMAKALASLPSFGNPNPRQRARLSASAVVL